MAHSRDIYPPVCSCGKEATIKVYGHRNEPFGAMCSICGRDLISKLNTERAALLETSSIGKREVTT